jgi:hypothetical protein
MNAIVSLLKQVAATPDTVTADPSTPMVAFPGIVEHNFDLHLANGFTVGDWMNDEAVSVAEELQGLDIGPPGTKHKPYAAVWRIALVDGPVVLMNIEISGVEDDDFNECHLLGYGAIVDDLDAAPFVAEVMKQHSRVEAFKAIEKILADVHRLRTQFEEVFADGLQRTEALQRLAQA